MWEWHSVLINLKKKLRCENCYGTPYGSAILKIKEQFLNMTPLMNSFLESQTQRTKLAVHVNLYSWETSGTVRVFLSLFISAQHTPRDPTPLLMRSGSQTFSSAGGLTSPAAFVSMAPSECSLCSKIPVPFTVHTHRDTHIHIHTRWRIWIMILCRGSTWHEGN